MDWLMPANAGIFMIRKAFREIGYIDWSTDNLFEVGDVVYLYVTDRDHVGRVMYKTTVIRVRMGYNDINENMRNYYIQQIGHYDTYVRLKFCERVNKRKLWYDYLRDNGLQGPPQAAMRLNNDRGELREYIESFFDANNAINSIFPDEDIRYYEGIISHNLICCYERNPQLRAACIRENGVNCTICGMNFEETYGNIGQGFIHVHHKVPLNRINNGRYNHVCDLIPICPNCHAMIHRLEAVGNHAVEELRRIVRDQRRRR